MSKIGDVAIELLEKHNETYLGYAHYELTQDVWEECFKRGIIKQIGSRGGQDRPHPLNKISRIVKALEKDKRFSSDLIRCCGFSKGDGERLIRLFYLN